MEAKSLIAGLGGAIVLTLLNESLKNINEDMPHIDLVGEEAVLKSAAYLGINITNNDVLYGTTLVADMISNATYFSLIKGDGKELWAKAASAGLVAGIGAVKLPSRMGLNDEPVAKSLSTKAWTVGYYMMGALTTAAIMQVLRNVRQK